MTAFVVVLCTVPSDEVGRGIARVLVEARAAACVNILPPMRSIYRWEGEIADEPEHQLVIKTLKEKLPEVERLITAQHPYSVPEIIALDVAGGSEAYLTWVELSTR